VLGYSAERIATLHEQRVIQASDGVD